MVEKDSLESKYGMQKKCMKERERGREKGSKRREKVAKGAKKYDRTCVRWVTESKFLR